MNRRHFIQSGSFAILAAAGLPKAVKGIQKLYPSTYRTQPDTEKKGQWCYEIILYHNGFENFSTSQPEEKIIVLKVAYFETNDFTKPSQQGEYRYIIKEAVKEPDTATTAIWLLTTKFDKKISGDHKFEKEFPKNPKLRCTEYAKIDILAKDGAVLESLPYPSSSGDGDSDGCFLTTACVQHMRLADDCDELQTLRNLRDKHMAASEEGIELIKQYRITGPAIIKAINNCINKDEIYGYMYSKMITPAVQLVKEGRPDEAVAYYRLFVKELMGKYQ